MPQKILIVDDEPNITLSFSSLLQDEGYQTTTAATAEEAIDRCLEASFDLVLLDLHLPGQSGIDFLKSIKEELHPPMVLVVSGQSDIPTALQAIKLGAIDYLEKPVQPEKLISSLRSSLMLATANRQRNMMVSEIDQSSQIIGNSKAIKKLLKIITQAAPSQATILITGENGTGKELVATRIYLESQRRDKPFIKVNCPGIPTTLFESELFGHAKGAFTGAVKDYPGKFVLADGGTIFLDEIGDLPLECQAKLLRVLETGEVETLGSVQKRLVDVRVISATNKNLQKFVREGKFREDLFYRISVFLVEVPPLRDRLDDIPLLVGVFLKRFDPAQTTRLSAEALAYLTTLNYPGNVRQLKNIIERLTILFHDRTVEVDDLVAHAVPCAPSGSLRGHTSSLSEKIADFEKYLIKKTLDDSGGNISEAARLLRIDRANLSKKIKELKLKNT